MLRKLPFFGKARRPASPPESVYFYTLHKCASSLFSDYVLKNARGLQLVDYSDQFYNGTLAEEVTFEQRGFVYGPLRLSTGPPSLIHAKLIEPISQTEFVRDKVCVFLIRDPRDILVSAYYSFGYSHEFSAVKQIREQQERIRDFVRSRTVDDYVLECAPAAVIYFQTVDRLLGACERSILLKYEDMINDWEKFASGLTRYLDISRRTLRQVYKRTRPRLKEDLTAHRRSGKTGAYKEKLLPSTVEALNTPLATILARFGYEC
jgi:Sulfotransferase domain